MIACLYATLGAMIGGTAIWFWALFSPDVAHSLLVWLPGISDAMIDGVRVQLADLGVVALFIGPLGGIPYKVYAVEAATGGYSILAFLAISIAARLSRFALVTVVAGAISALLQRWFTLRTVTLIHAFFWSAFYCWYFWIMSGT